MEHAQSSLQPENGRLTQHEEAVLRDSEEKYRALTELSAHMVWMLDPHGRLLYGNKQWFDYTGLTLEYVQQHGWQIVIHPEDQHAILAAFERYVAQGSEYTMELRLRSKEGNYRWHVTRARPAKDQHGSVLNWIGVTFDIEEQKQAEADAHVLAELGERIRVSDHAETLFATVTHMLGQHLQLTRCFFAGVNQTTGQITIHSQYRASETLSPTTSEHYIATNPPEIIEVAQAGRRVVIHDTATDPLTAAYHNAIYVPFGTRAFAAIPLLRDGSLVAGLGAYSNAPRTWAARELSLLETVAERTWNAVERIRLDEKLRRSEARFRAIQETSIDGFMILESVRDANGSITDFRWQYANEAAERIIGKPHSWLSGRLLLEEMPGNRTEGLFDAYVRVVETGEPWTKEFSYQHEGLDVYLRAVAAKADDGFAISFADLSERRKAEQRIRESEERYRMFVANSSEGVYRLEFEPPIDASQPIDTILDQVYARGRFAECNDAFARMYGFDRAEDVFGHGLALTLPPEIPEAREYLRFLIESGYRADDVESVEQDKHGNPVYFTNSINGVIEDGMVIRVWGTQRNITDRKRAEEQLRESETKFRNMADNISQLAWMTDETGWIFWYNQRWYDFTGTTLESMKGWGWQSVHHADHVERVVTPFKHSVDTGQPWEDTFPLRGKNGEYRWFLSRALPIRNEHDQIVRWFGTNTDITEQRAVEAELRAAMEREQALRAQAEEASRLKDEFLATVSHELRTPLTSILGYGQLIQTRKRDEAYVARTIDKVVQSARTQAQLIEDLLDVSRIVTGKLRIETQPLDFIAVIHAALDTVRPAVESKGLHLHVDLRPEASTIIGDANRLQQVVWNLLANAAKFTPSGGTVSVHLEQHGTQAQLVVSDTGQGISSDFLPYVFDRFRQAEATSTRAHGGLGLGLAIVRHLVELHGGIVSVASAGLAQGATFTVMLPLAHAEETNASSNTLFDETIVTYPPELQGMRILIVDDQPDILELLHDTLSPSGALIQLATSAPEALHMLQEWRPDVLISDIAMPHKDGYWLIEHVRALPEAAGGHTPAIALTAYVRAEERARVLANGFQHYVPKPVEPNELIAIVILTAKEASH